MRPTGDQGNFTVATEQVDGKVRVVVTALDKDDEFLNFLNMSGSVVGPDMQAQSMDIQQTAPGRYVGEFDSDQAGSYFLNLLPGGGHAPIRTGVNVPYSAEFRDRETNMELLERLAERVPQGGNAGQLISGPVAPGKTDPLLSVNPFRRDLARAISSRDIWPLLVLLSSCAFFADVFVRRVNLGTDWIKPAWEKVAAAILRRDVVPEVDERMERLRQRKAQLEGSLDDRRTATRFEPSPDAEADTRVLDAAALPSAPPKTESGQPLGPDTAEPEDYTARLLRAKKQAWKDRPDGRGDDAK